MTTSFETKRLEPGEESESAPIESVLSSLMLSGKYSSVLLDDLVSCEWVSYILNEYNVTKLEGNQQFRKYVEVVLGFSPDIEPNLIDTVLNEAFQLKTSNPLKILAKIRTKTNLINDNWKYLQTSTPLIDDFKSLMRNSRAFFIFGLRNKIIQWNPSYIRDCHLVATTTIYFILKNQIWLELEEDPVIHQKLLKLKASDIYTLATLINDYQKIGQIHKILATVGCKIFPKHPVFREDRLNQLKYNFRKEYLDDLNNLDRFSEYLRNCYTKHIPVQERSKYFSPCISMVQSNGNGKSRLCVEYGKTKEPVIYLSLAKETLDCYPRGMFAYYNYFSRAANSDKEMMDLLYFILISGIRHLSTLVKSNLKKKQVLTDFLNDQDIHHHQGKVLGAPGDKQYSHVTLDQAVKEFQLSVKASKYPEEKYPVIVLVLDEVRDLLSATFQNEGYIRFCKCLNRIDAMLATEMRIFSVLINVSSQVRSTLIPMIQGDVKYFHQPFVGVVNMDLWFLNYKSGKMKEQEFFEKENFFKIGRPLWMLSKSSIGLALNRILVNKSNGEYSKESLIAVLNIRIPLNIHPYGEFVENLSLNHMRLVRSISPDQQFFHGSYGNEPILAEAARWISKDQFDDFSPYKLLGVLNTLIVSGLVDKLGVGEQILGYIYILARDKLVDDSWNSHPIFKVSEFLSSIHGGILENLVLGDFERPQKVEGAAAAVEGNAGVETDQETDVRRRNLHVLLDGDVSFSHFLEVENIPGVSQLKEAFYRGMGFVSKPNITGVDIFIPVRIKKIEQEDIFVGIDEESQRGKSTTADNLVMKGLEKLSEREIESLMKMKKAYQMKISDLVENSENYSYTAICIQSRKLLGYDICMDINVPYLAIKHVLKSDDFSIKPMRYGGKPYRHGVVIKGMDDSLLKGIKVGAKPAEFWQRVRTVLNAQFETFT
jgi:hypothetical protein